MENKYLAKTEKEKTIKQHTQDLINQYNTLKRLYPLLLQEKEWELLLDAIKYHDLGKVNTKFQNKLYQKLGYTELLEDHIKGEEIPHNFLSPCFIETKKLKEKYTEEELKILVTAVYYHHDRIKMEITEEAVEDLKNQIEQMGEFFSLPFEKIKMPYRYIVDSLEIEDSNFLRGEKYIKVKGLLNKIDYVASLDKQGVNVEEEVYQEKKSIADKIKEITKEKFQNNYRPVQTYMLENQEENLVVVSPTGSGKTEACLLWIGESKAFYTLPLKVSINAIYERIYNQIDYKKALLLHSDAYSYYMTIDKQNQMLLYDRARRMSAPLIVTTVDQIFKIAFRYKGYEEILATLSYSKVIIDEIQMYSPELLAYILLGLKMLSKIGGKFAIVTATFPPLLYDLMDNLQIPYKRQEKLFKATIENRHKIKVLKNSDMEIEKIREDAKNKKVLVIVNTVKKAQELYELLKYENVYLLHSQYLKEDKKELEKAILSFSEKGIWISTQIVEASLDIDFDVLYTDMCTIDSLFQRMGRVYRKREYKEEMPNIYIYDNNSGGSKVVDPEIYSYSLEEIVKKNEKMLSEEEKQEMIENIFDLQKNPRLRESKYYDSIHKKIELLEDTIPNRIAKKEIQELFRNIQSILLIPENVYEQLNNIGKIEEWNQKMHSNLSINEKMQIKEEISKYTISVSWNPYIEYDKEELFYINSNIHRTRYPYEFDKKTKKGRGLIKKVEGDNFD